MPGTWQVLSKYWSNLIEELSSSQKLLFPLDELKSGNRRDLNQQRHRHSPKAAKSFRAVQNKSSTVTPCGRNEQQQQGASFLLGGVLEAETDLTLTASAPRDSRAVETQEESQSGLLLISSDSLHIYQGYYTNQRQNLSVSTDVKLKPLFIAGRKVQRGYCGRHGVVVPQKFKHRIMLWSKHLFPRNVPQELKAGIKQIFMYPCHLNIVHNSQKV